MMNYLHIVAIAKDEGPYLAEWCAYHLALGADRIFLYDNESAVPITDSLRTFIERSGRVSVFPIHGRGMQMAAYGTYLKHHGAGAKWAAFIDVDEFIVPHIHADIPDLLEGYEAYGGLGLHWKCFSSSGHLTKPEGLVIESYWKTNGSLPVDQHIKSIVQPTKVDGYHWDPHQPVYRPPHHAVDTRREGIRTPRRAICHDLARIHHYFTRSREEFAEKIVRGRADLADPNAKRRWEEFDEMEALCGTEDRTIEVFIDRTREVLRKYA